MQSSSDPNETNLFITKKNTTKKYVLFMERSAFAYFKATVYNTRKIYASYEWNTRIRARFMFLVLLRHTLGSTKLFLASISYMNLKKGAMNSNEWREFRFWPFKNIWKTNVIA